MSDNIDFIEQLVNKAEARIEMLERGLTQAQRELTYGDCAMVITPVSTLGKPFAVGRILSPTEVQLIQHMDQQMRAHGSENGLYANPRAGESPGTVEEERHRYEQGFRFGMWHDASNTSGFTAHIHYTRLFPITQEEFESAAALDYSIDSVGDLDWFTAVSKAMLEKIEALEETAERMPCEKCGSRETMIVAYYRGRYKCYSARKGDEVRLGGVTADEVGKVLSRHLHCEVCDHEGPDLNNEPLTFTDVQRGDLGVIETVFGYGSDLPLPDWSD